MDLQKNSLHSTIKNGFRSNLPSAIATVIWFRIAERSKVMKTNFGFVGISMSSSCATDKQEIPWRAGGGA
jgi:hypothetical protein